MRRSDIVFFALSIRAGGFSRDLATLSEALASGFSCLITSYRADAGSLDCQSSVVRPCLSARASLKWRLAACSALFADFEAA